MKVVLAFPILLFFVVVHASVAAAEIGPQPQQIEHTITSDGKQYDLKLTKPDVSILHPNIQVIQIDLDNDGGYHTADSWAPSNAEIKEAEDVLVDEANLAAVRMNYENGERSFRGIIDGMRLEEENGIATLYTASLQNRSDYIDLGRNLTMPTTRDGGRVNAVVEVVVVCDKEWGDVFQHDRKKILDYWTLYFWDINLRFKTLPSNSISFRVNGIVVISSPSGQPFIEEARASDGRAEFNRILDRFASWIYGQMSTVPKFDMAIAVTNTRLEWGGGLAYMRATCWVDHAARRHWGTLVFSDGGDFGSLTVGSHEMAHTLGAPHDDDPNIPGGCQDRGYIMSGGNENLKWFFSTCSDRTISALVRSTDSACLRKIDELSSPQVNANFSSYPPPDMDEQCRRRLKNPTAYVEKADKGNCKSLKCWAKHEDGRMWLWTLGQELDNTPCTGGRCFRGRCRKEGKLIRNVATLECMRATNPFEFMAPLDLVDCPRPIIAGTPLDRFVLTDEPLGKTLATPWSSLDATENGDKCVYTGYIEGGGMWTDRCNVQNPWHGWDFIDVGNGEFMISHRITKRCAKPDGVNINTYSNCNKNDPTMRWRLY
ncbi:A disintegrin and metalloproteinase with thrombospondin motifs 13 [Orchesella cincta]|uniref:A disintegrin and metalloproteinase with thrombospondin motifs 13 n=1 Tax=Orchesella cincta TaxID=48709 RepID=A0A1D2NMF9_ORCCI|nr:A disintegrin and metalloproteinase with thrombospondin motifs 13 [Orchesella cincta]